MSLDFDLSLVPEEVRTITVAGEKVMSPVTQNLIFSTMAVGIGELTEETIPEFYARLSMWERLHGESYTKLETIRAHIGLKTNVFPMETRAKWMKRIIISMLDDDVRRAKRAK